MTSKWEPGGPAQFRYLDERARYVPFREETAGKGVCSGMLHLFWGQTPILLSTLYLFFPSFKPRYRATSLPVSDDAESVVEEGDNNVVSLFSKTASCPRT